MFVRRGWGVVLGLVLISLGLPVSIAAAAPASDLSSAPPSEPQPSYDVRSAESGAPVPPSPASHGAGALQATNVAYTIHPDSRPIEITTLSSALSAGISGGLVAGAVGGSQANAIGTQTALSQVQADADGVGRQALVPDPAPTIAQRVADTLAKRVSGTVLDPAIQVKRHEKLKTRLPASNYFVDVETASWSVVYFLTDMGRYGLYYIGTYAIYAPGDVKPKVQGICNFAPKKSDDSPNGKQLAADNFAAVKRMVSAAADRCQAQIEAQFSKLT